MISDIVLPDGNEKELVLMAERLGYNKIYFAYYSSKPKPTKLPKTKISIEVISIARTIKDISKSRREIVMYQGTEDIRKAIELGPSIICDIETSSRNDFIHHRNSGLNQVTAKIASLKKVNLGVPFSTLLLSRSRHILLGRMSQNVAISRKYGLKVKVFSFAREQFEMRSPAELKSLAYDLGINDPGNVLQYDFC